MKIFTRLSFFILLLLISFKTNAQGNISYNYWWAFDVYLLDYNPIEIKNDSTFSEARIVVTKNKNTETFIKKYNEKGLLTEYYRGKNSDSIEKLAIMSYDENSLLQTVKFYKKHKLHHQYLYSFNEKSKITQLLKNNAEGEVIRNRGWKYNADGYVEEATDSKKKSMEIKYRWTYEYYDVGKLEKVSKYKKGELKEEWDYMCNPVGDNGMKKNENRVCISKETSDDTLTEVYQTTDDKGRTQKSVYKYTAADTLILEQIHYNNKNEIRSKMTYDKSLDKQLTYFWYKKGKPAYQRIQTFADGKLVSAIGRNKDKIKSRMEYVYNTENQLTEYRRYGKKDKLKEEIKVEYVK